MSDQIFVTAYYDPDHERATIYSSAPIELKAILTLVDAYRVVEAQFLKHPILLIFDENNQFGTMGVPTWAESVRLISPQDMKDLEIDSTAMFCVNRPFLAMLSSESKGIDTIDMLGSITLEVIESIFLEKTCFIALVSQIYDEDDQLQENLDEILPH